MKFENTEVWGFEHAIRGMRNPMNSWEKSDSGKCEDLHGFQEKTGEFISCDCDDQDCSVDNCERVVIGFKDLALMQRLIKSGAEHRKFMRQVFVSVDITAPMYWWKEFDTYKIGTVANSTSTMHKLTSQPITIDCFEIDDYDGSLNVKSGEHYNEDDGISNNAFVSGLIDRLEGLRLKYLEAKDKRYWKELVRWLPESWLQTRTITMNYENAYNMVYQRKNHKLNEWSGVDDSELPNFISWAKTLPYADELLFIEKEL